MQPLASSATDTGRIDMVDWAYVCGMADDTGNDPDEETHDPEGRCGYSAFNQRQPPQQETRRPHRASIYASPLECRYCGAFGLYWQVIKGTYVIYEHATLTPHSCPTNSEGFEDVF